MTFERPVTEKSSQPKKEERDAPYMRDKGRQAVEDAQHEEFLEKYQNAPVQTP